MWWNSKVYRYLIEYVDKESSQTTIPVIQTILWNSEQLGT